MHVVIALLMNKTLTRSWIRHSHSILTIWTKFLCPLTLVEITLGHVLQYSLSLLGNESLCNPQKIQYSFLTEIHVHLGKDINKRNQDLQGRRQNWYSFEHGIHYLLFRDSRPPNTTIANAKPTRGDGCLSFCGRWFALAASCWVPSPVLLIP